MITIEWETDASGWATAALAGGGFLSARRRSGGGWAPAWVGPSGHVLWHGDPLPALEAAQRAAEAELQRAAGRYGAQRAAGG